MKKEDRRRWCACLLALALLGAAVIVLCSRFQGFQGPYTAPAILAGICLVSGGLLLVLP